MENPDCFFILDMNVPDENRKIETFCVPCYLETGRDDGWFWEGSKRGYGPFMFKCDICETIIHKPEE